MFLLVLDRGILDRFSSGGMPFWDGVFHRTENIMAAAGKTNHTDKMTSKRHVGV